MCRFSQQIGEETEAFFSCFELCGHCMIVHVARVFLSVLIGLLD